MRRWRLLSGLLLSLGLAGCGEEEEGDRPPCTLPQIKCGDVCVVLTDNNSCGACGTRCDTTVGFYCSDGRCVCRDGLTECAGICIEFPKDTAKCGTFVGLPINCSQTSLPSGARMQCTAQGVRENGQMVSLTNVVSWRAVNCPTTRPACSSNSTCAGTAGTVSDGPPGTEPKGTFTAATAGCMSDVSATYTAGGTTLESNTVTVTVTN